MKLRAILPQIFLIGFSLALVLAVHRNAPTFIRSTMAVFFLFFCPGLAFVWLLNIRDRLVNFVLTISLSLALDTIISEAIVLTHDWSSDRALLILVCLTCVGAFLKIMITLHNISKRAEL